MSLAASFFTLGRALSYRARSYALTGSARSAYRSFKNGLINSADGFYQNRDPVFAMVDWEGLGREVAIDVTLPLASFSRSTTLIEKLCLGMLLRLDAPQTIFELGTYRGATTLLLFRNAPETARIFSFDIPAGIDRVPSLDRTRLLEPGTDGLEDGFERDFFPRSPRVRQVYADLGQVDWVHLRALGTPDFVFIDADHSYEGCLRDSRHILDWVGDEAMVVWHDASWRKFSYLEARYGVHASIVDATRPEALPYTFRIRDTSLLVRSRRHAALFQRHVQP